MKKNEYKTIIQTQELELHNSILVAGNTRLTRISFQVIVD